MQEGGYYTRQKPGPNASPLISVVTVCYNVESLLAQCIHSVSLQDFKVIEHIIIDGESTDNTVGLLKERDREVAYWRSEKDSGIYSAMNKALNYVHGKWIVFLGADDQLLPGFSNMVSCLKNDHTVYYSNVLYDTIPVGREINGYFLAKNNICHQSILYPKAVFKKYSFEEKYVLYADHYLNMQCWSDPDFDFEYFNLLTARFSTEGASSRKKDVYFEQDKAMLIRKHFGYLAYWRYLFKGFKSKSRKVDSWVL
ncbi:MAG: glycosyltransferase family 2 protein [Anditalea sp.]